MVRLVRMTSIIIIRWRYHLITAPLIVNSHLDNVYESTAFDKYG